MFLTTKYKVISNLYIKSVTRVKTTPVAEKIVEFYEINKFSLKTTPFYKKRPHFIENYPFFIENYPPFIKKKTTDHLPRENSNLSFSLYRKLNFWK